MDDSFTRGGTVSQAISSDYIRLDAFLKLAGAVLTGGQAKTLIQEGHVKVNGDPCPQRGRKLREGDTVSVDQTAVVYRVTVGQD